MGSQPNLRLWGKSGGEFRAKFRQHSGKVPGEGLGRLLAKGLLGRFRESFVENGGKGERSQQVCGRCARFSKRSIQHLQREVSPELVF